MKRIAAIILALCMLFSLAACGKDTSKRRPSTTTDLTKADIEKLIEELEQEEAQDQ